jgi:hypothetical protein
MKLLALSIVAATATLLAGAAPLRAAPLAADTTAPALSDSVIPVAEGCGPGRWRGPWGGCRGPGYGPGPGYYGPNPGWHGNGCPPGFWRGPWGHCRDTPYHGRLPGGGWK